MQLWLRGRLADNATNNAGGDVELFDYSWIDGNIVLDRDVWCGTANAFGMSLAGGLVRFGVDSGDTGPSNDTIEGSENVLDDTWHHVAVVRDASAGSLAIIVDGVEDFRGSPGLSCADLSYPDSGIPVTGDCNTGQRTPYGWYLVVAAEKHDADAAFPSFNGYADELRIRNVARSAGEAGKWLPTALTAFWYCLPVPLGWWVSTASKREAARWFPIPPAPELPTAS